MDAAWFGASRILSAKLEVQWDGTNWTDETSRLMSANGRAGVPFLWENKARAFTPGQATFTVRSPSDRFSPYNSGSPIYAYIKDNGGYGIPIRFSAAVKDGADVFQWERVFTGFVDNIELTSIKYNRTRIKAIDGSHPYLQTKKSTATIENYTASEWIAYLAALVGITGASIDAGLTDIPFCWLDNENVINEMQQVAQVDGGVVFFDRDGVLTFRGAESFLERAEYTTSQHTFTVSNMRETKAAWNWENVYNAVIVPYTPRGLGSTGTEIYTLTRPFSINAGASKTIAARHKYPAQSVDGTISSTILTGAGDDISADVAITVTNYAQFSELLITNNHAYQTANVLKLSISGTPILGRKSEQVESTATSLVIGDPATTKKSFPIASNPYLQTRAQATILADMLIGRLVALRGKYKVDAPALPAIEPLHRVTLVDSGSMINRAALLSDISWAFNKGDFSAQYGMIDASGWYPSADTPCYLKIGTDTTGSGKVLFY